MRKIFKILITIVSIVVVGVLAIIIYYCHITKFDSPIENEASYNVPQLIRYSDSLDFCSDSWLKHEDGGIYEMYLSGDAYMLGLKNGILTQQLNYEQETAFLNFLKTIVPSSFNLGFLKYFVAWFNRNIDIYVPLEYRQEIYAISKYASHDFDFISEPYHRAINYHAAHDIGHMVANMHLVRCSAFAVHNDSTFLVGRNFDFSSGDDFARNKIVAFYKPQFGNKFMMVTWAGMIGTVSGMNEHGLTITLNAANSEIPMTAKTPVSIVAREVMQYASNLDEAYEIIRKRDTFVSELFFVASAKDGKAAVFEKTLDTTIAYFSETDRTLLTNHFQSKYLENTPQNLDAIADNISTYRYARMVELLDSIRPSSVNDVAEILRNQRGLNNENIGRCNEKALNQLIAHHSVIFDPKNRIAWVSQYPYQLGEFNAYEFDRIFADTFDIRRYSPITSQLSIPADPFLQTDEYLKIQRFRAITDSLNYALLINDTTLCNRQLLNEFQTLNPDFYNTYYLSAKCYLMLGDTIAARKMLQKSLTKDVVGNGELNKIRTILESLDPNIDKSYK